MPTLPLSPRPEPGPAQLLGSGLLLLLALSAQLGCSRTEYYQPLTPTAVPIPTPVPDPDGDPPNWSDCVEGYAGHYYNLSASDPAIVDPAPLPPDTLPEDLSWWDESRLAFSRYDSSLDFGLGWWPVDQGLEGDPAYFSAYWTAWVRQKAPNSVLELHLGAATDAWVIVNKQVIALPGPVSFSPGTWSVPLPQGQYPVEVYFAQRAADQSGFSLRMSGVDLQVCYPQF